MEKLDKDQLKKQQIKILFSSSALCFLSGMYYMWSILSNAMVNNLGWTSSQASLPYTVYTIAFAVAMFIFGRIQDKKGPTLIVLAGSILMGLGLILSGIILNPFTLVITAGIIAGLGVGMINSSVVAPALKWFPSDKNGLVTGITLAGTGLAPILYSPLGEYLVNNTTLERTFIIIGIISLVPSLFLVKNIINPKEELFSSSDDEISDEKHQYTWKEMLKDPNAYKLWIMFSVAATAGLMMIGHVSAIADIQINWQTGTVLVVILAVFNTLGRIIGGIGSDRIGRLRFLQIMLVIQLINMISFNFYSVKSTLILGVLVGGFCYGSNFSIFPAFVADMYGKKHYGINYGIIFSAFSIGGILGPMIGAKIFDATGAYFTAYKAAAVLLAIGFIISLTFREKKDEIQE